MLKKLRNKINLLAAFYIFMLIMLSSLFLFIFYAEKTGKAWIIEDSKFIEEFDSITNPWNYNTFELDNIFEEYWNRSFNVTKLGSSSGLSISLSDISLSDNGGQIWLRLKLNNDIDSSGFLPIILLGDMLFFRGGISGGTIKPGEQLYVADSQGNSKGADNPATAWQADEWHEILIWWGKNQNSEQGDCLPGGKEFWLQIIIDNSPDINFYLGRCMSEPFPFSMTDGLYIFPAESSLASFSIDAEIQSGFSIDKLISSSKTREGLGEISIVNTDGSYFSNLNQNPHIEKNAGIDSIIYSNIIDTCRVWNKPNLRGDVEIVESFEDDVTLEMSGSDLVIQSMPQGIETRAGFRIRCKYGSSSDEENIYLTIGNPEILTLEIKDYFVMDKNEIKYISYNASFLGGDFLPATLQYSITGNNIVDVAVYDKNQKTIKLQSYEQDGAEDLTFTITDYVGESVSKEFRVKVRGDNQPPTIDYYSPQQLNLEIVKGNSVEFGQTSSDDRTANLEYAWYVDNFFQTTNQNYTFQTKDVTLKTYAIKLKVSDDEGLSEIKEWNIIVRADTPPQYNDSNGSYTPPSGYICGNGILEPGEECDGSQRISSCYGLLCYQNNCICDWPPRNESCTIDWTCTDWSDCQVSIRTRQCTDNNLCKTNEGKPAEIEFCQEQDNENQPDSSRSQDEKQQQNQDTISKPEINKQTESPPVNPKSLEQEPVRKPDVYKPKKDFLKKSPEEKLFATLLWILISLCIILVIILGASKLSKIKPKTRQIPKKKNSPEYQRLANVVRDYKAKGIDTNSAYNMLLKMGYDKKDVHNMIYEVYYQQK